MNKKPTILPTYNPTDLSIAFFGTPRIAQIVLKRLIATEFKPQLVITGHDRKLGRGQALVPTSVKLEAQKNNIEVSHRMSDLDKSFDIAILVDYGHIIPKTILQRPKFGFLNVHPSLLPKFRGPSPIYQTILNGDQKTGVTIIKLDKELDHGPIIVVTTTPDVVFPSTACILQQKLGIKSGGPAFDLQAVCSGFIYALATADQFIRSGQSKCALVVGAETFSRIMDWTVRNTCVLFGDGAGAVCPVH